MLKLRGIVKTVNEKMESDFYIPIKIKFGDLDHSVYHKLYLLTGNLLEIGLYPIDGAIASITLVTASKIYFHTKPTEDISKKNEKFGLPLFSTEKWTNNNYYLDENRDKDFEVYIEENDVTIVLAPHKIKTKITNDRVVFGIDGSGLLCTIEVKNLKPEELSLLEESFRSMKAL